MERHEDNQQFVMTMFMGYNQQYGVFVLRLCLNQGLVNVLMFHTTQVLGRFHLQQIFVSVM